jgi:hypothetical protein
VPTLWINHLQCRRYLSTKLHGVTFQKTIIIIVYIYFDAVITLRSHTSKSTRRDLTGSDPPPPPPKEGNEDNNKSSGRSDYIRTLPLNFQQDWPITRNLPTQDNTNTEKMQTYTHAPSGIQTHDPSVLAVGGDSTQLAVKKVKFVNEWLSLIVL